ncbi:MAG: ComEA family DNA-binding protein [Oscillospiraceae bacterium]
MNINAAPAEELEALPGVGPVRAAAIVEYRTAHGSFKNPEELLNVPGIGERTLEGMRSHLSF